jgi:hypothetical protein
MATVATSTAMIAACSSAIKFTRVQHPGACLEQTAKLSRCHGKPMEMP